MKVAATLIIIFATIILDRPPEGCAADPDANKLLEIANKEGKVVAGIPASAELRKALGESFAKRFPGIELELTTARGPTNASKIAAEHAAGVRYYDLLISGTLTPLSLLNAGILEPSSRCLFSRKSKIHGAGMAVIFGPTRRNDFSTLFRRTNRRTFGIIPNR